MQSKQQHSVTRIIFFSFIKSDKVKCYIEGERIQSNQSQPDYVASYIGVDDND